MVIGAGFGGLACAKELAKADVDVTIVDRNNFHTFQPLLYQVATAGLNAADVAYPVRGVLRRQRRNDFRRAEVTGVDWDRRLLRLREGAEPGLRDVEGALDFDHLVIAGGSWVHFFGIDGAEEHAFPLYSLADAVRLRNHVLSRFEVANAEPDQVANGALTVVVVGGGPTGVEVAGALAELFTQVMPGDYPGLEVSAAKVVLAEQADRPLAPFSAASQRNAVATLEDRGVEVRLGESITQVTDRFVVLASGEKLPTQTVVWAAGIQAAPLASRLDLPQTKGGRITVDDHLAVPGHERVWAVGDIAAQTQDGEPLPQLAPVAIQGGRYVAGAIAADLSGGPPPPPFRYRDKGIMATIGRRAAVVELPIGLKLRGSLAWLAWLGLHLLTLLGMRNRLSVLLNWAWNYFTWDRGPRLILEPTESPLRAAEARR